MKRGHTQHDVCQEGICSVFKYSIGSLNELDTQVEIAVRLGYLPEQHRIEVISKIGSISMKLAGLINKTSKTSEK